RTHAPLPLAHGLAGQQKTVGSEELGRQSQGSVASGSGSVFAADHSFVATAELRLFGRATQPPFQFPPIPFRSGPTHSGALSITRFIRRSRPKAAPAVANRGHRRALPARFLSAPTASANSYPHGG